LSAIIGCYSAGQSRGRHVPHARW